MRRKILTVLVQITALSALMAVPAAAQATDLMLGGELAEVGTQFNMTGELTFEDHAGRPYICRDAVFHGVVTNNAETPEADITEADFETSPESSYPSGYCGGFYDFGEYEDALKPVFPELPVKMKFEEGHAEIVNGSGEGDLNLDTTFALGAPWSDIANCSLVEESMSLSYQSGSGEPNLESLYLGVETEIDPVKSCNFGYFGGGYYLYGGLHLEAEL